MGIYNLLRLWLDNKNGRRLRIRIGNVEVEATQMNQDDFMHLVERALRTGEKTAAVTNSPRGPMSGPSSFPRSLTLHEFLELNRLQTEVRNTGDSPDAGGQEC